MQHVSDVKCSSRKEVGERTKVARLIRQFGEQRDQSNKNLGKTRADANRSGKVNYGSRCMTRGVHNDVDQPSLLINERAISNIIASIHGATQKSEAQSQASASCKHGHMAI
jgi:hypothetical protein